MQSRGSNKVKLIVAYSLPTYSIGLNGSIPWRYPEDLLLFRYLTINHPVIMGHKTWDSLPRNRPLPGRLNIVVASTAITRIPRSTHNFDCASSLELALERAKILPKYYGTDTFIIGGASLYKEALSKGRVDEIIATEIVHHHPGDTFFPSHYLTSWQHTATLLSTPDFTTKVYTPLPKEEIKP